MATREDMLRTMIEEYRRKIETYQLMIREWEAELGFRPNLESQGVAAVSSDDRKERSATGEPSSLVRHMQFFRKTQPEAAKAFLELVNHPLRTADIIEGIEKGGVKVGGKTPKDKKTNLYTILYRSEDFGLVAKDTWGLTAWPGVNKERSKTFESGVEAVEAGVNPVEVADELAKPKK